MCVRLGTILRVCSCGMTKGRCGEVTFGHVLSCLASIDISHPSKAENVRHVVFDWNCVSAIAVVDSTFYQPPLPVNSTKLVRFLSFSVLAALVVARTRPTYLKMSIHPIITFKAGICDLDVRIDSLHCDTDTDQVN